MAKAKARTRVDSRVRALRLARGWSQTTLAGLARTGLATVRAAESGEVLHLQVFTLLRLANALEVAVADCWPILGPMPRRVAEPVRSSIRASLARLDAKRARIAESEGGAELQALDRVSRL